MNERLKSISGSFVRVSLTLAIAGIARCYWDAALAALRAKSLDEGRASCRGLGPVRIPWRELLVHGVTL
jgi:hypothetical protein